VHVWGMKAKPLALYRRRLCCLLAAPGVYPFKTSNDSLLPAALLCRGIGPCFVVRDHNGQQLAYVYFENEPGRRSAAKLLSRDEARRIAVNIAKLPD
jgi:DNA-binding LacI/PurR family transcriptional regulator